MAIRADSYSSTSEVKAMVRHLLDGQSAFNTTTRPSGTELEKFIDRASGVLNMALAQHGFAPSAVIANSTARLMCDDWVTAQAAKWAELTQRGTGYSDQPGSRIGAFAGLYKSANEMVELNKLGIQRLGVAQAHPMSEGLDFTGMDAQANRADPQDDSLEQPMFNRHQFDFPKSAEGPVSVGSETDGEL